jgi:hypothetical protein
MSERTTTKNKKVPTQKLRSCRFLRSNCHAPHILPACSKHVRYAGWLCVPVYNRNLKSPLSAISS